MNAGVSLADRISELLKYDPFCHVKYLCHQNIVLFFYSNVVMIILFVYFGLHSISKSGHVLGKKRFIGYRPYCNVFQTLQDG